MSRREDIMRELKEMGRPSLKDNLEPTGVVLWGAALVLAGVPEHRRELGLLTHVEEQAVVRVFVGDEP
jgi:hypothetical protein